jgi:hypothetical protein
MTSNLRCVALGVSINLVLRSSIRLLQLRPKMIAAVRERFPELVDGRLIQMDDGSWMDVVQWRSRDAAERAAAAIGEIPEATAMMSLVEESVLRARGRP